MALGLMWQDDICYVSPPPLRTTTYDGRRTTSKGQRATSNKQRQAGAISISRLLPSCTSSPWATHLAQFLQSRYIRLCSFIQQIRLHLLCPPDHKLQALDPTICCGFTVERPLWTGISSNIETTAQCRPSSFRHLSIST